ncbi:putative short-chain dehydrogenase/reductase [Reticulomyxa filosa]|uniref:Putative short-chain dehydrogenase/reductase n=1 Tax=Reticulomyxa filosa TaxID=46433 RepID=X6P7E7_RETFI|nr:putative short-chain dehydrogenase/reductase [Reticulomyxa filosa]|eukprot:ETO34435.1 putative short-chain dehydrogenase/reductase [Reticulomyxa filosa]
MNKVLKEKILGTDKKLKSSQFSIISVQLDDLESVTKCAQKIAKVQLQNFFFLLLKFFIFGTSKKKKKLQQSIVQTLPLLGIFENSWSSVQCRSNVPTPKERNQAGSRVPFWCQLLVAFPSDRNFYSLLKKNVTYTQRWGALQWDDINLKSKYEKFLAYGQSCTARCTWATEFNRRHASKNGWLGFSLHPGIIETELQRDFTEKDFVRLHIKDEKGNIRHEHLARIMKTLDEGAATQVWALVDKNLSTKGGSFLQDCIVQGKWSGNPSDMTGYNDFIMDPVQGKKLWDYSLSVTEKFR